MIRCNIISRFREESLLGCFPKWKSGKMLCYRCSYFMDTDKREKFTEKRNEVAVGGWSHAEGMHVERRSHAEAADSPWSVSG